jgi:hypothetical protein
MPPRAAGRPRNRQRLSLWSFAAIVVFAVVAIEAFLVASVLIPRSDIWSLGMDYRFYRDVGARWLADGSFYLPRQLSGPYEAALMSDVVYPPSALLLFVPFAVLPAFLWWLLPMLILGYAIARLRPAPWAWFAIAILSAWPRATAVYLFGNTDIWAVAAVAAGILWGWPAALLVLKPTLLPFALPFVRGRAFWLGVAVVAAISLAMLPLWWDYLTALRGIHLDLEYVLLSVPLLTIPIVAWLGRTRSEFAPGTGSSAASPAIAPAEDPPTAYRLQTGAAAGSIPSADDRP